MALVKLKRLKFLFLHPAVALSLNRLSSNKVLMLEVHHEDVIDNFTSELIQKKCIKWDKLKFKNQIPGTPCNLRKHKYLDINIASCSPEELHKIFLRVTNENSEYLKTLRAQCIEENVCPEVATLLCTFSNFARVGNIEAVNELKSMVKILANDIYTTHAEFGHFLAEAMWNRGEVIKALDLFDSVYRNNAYLRRTVRLMLRVLISDVTNRSEAVLVNIVKFSEQILKDFKDNFLLSCVWQACFVSEFFTDQTLAMELLERNEGSHKVITNNISYILMIALTNHQIDIIYRLLELLLKYDLKSQYSNVLIALFNYRFKQGDLQSCSEIVKWSVENNVNLPTSLEEKFLMLLLNKSEAYQIPKKTKPPDYPLQF